MAGKLLSEMGAEVVRVRVGESGQPMAAAPGGLLDWWFDGGTMRAPLDLAAPTDRDTFRRLVAAADVLVETEPPGRMAGLGLDHASIAATNASLVHVSLTPFGADGPRAGWQASDLVIAAAGGILSVNGVPEEPVSMWGRQMDNLGGMYAAICALAGLFRARATGRGLHADLSQQQAVASCSEHVLMFWWWPEAFAAIGAPIAGRQASLHWSRAYEVVPCRRGHCMVSPSAGGVPDLLAWMADRGHAPAPTDADPTNPLAMVQSYMAALRAFASELDASDVFAGGQARHVPFGEVLTVPEVSECPQHLARGFFRPVEGTEISVPGPFARFTSTPCPAPEPPPERAIDRDDLDVLVQRWTNDHRVEAPAVPPDACALPLAGVRIVDFTHVLAGPFATRVLADLGAEVLKVQTDTRSAGAHANVYPYFAMWNRSKSSITLNMADPRALDVLRELVCQADVVIENFSAGVLEQWGAGWPEMSSWNERVVYLSMHGAGTDGPWRDHVTFAPTVHALSGVTALTGPEGRVDCGPGVALNDHVSGLVGAIAILAALDARRRTGRGQHVDISQLEVASYLVGPALVDWQANGREARASGTRDAFDDVVPNDVVRSADGRWLAVTARDDDDWRRLASILAVPEHLATVGARRAHRAEVAALLSTWAATLSAHDAVDALQRVGVPASVVQNADDLTQHDPQLRHRDWIVTLESGLFGHQHVDRFPARMRDADGTELQLVYRASPYLGEHNFDVYGDLLGLDVGEVAERMGDGLFA
jgi:crotonobetainyl-CoA:carnitine CoA-transferase CaiB-like acyl-CoA transferase